MKRFSSRHALAFGTLSVCGLSVALGVSNEACSSSSSSSNDAGSTAATACANPSLTVAFNPGYSAFIPNSMHTFQIPLGVKELTPSDKVTWTASDPTKVAFSNGSVDFGDAGAPIANTMVTTTGAGDVDGGDVTITITATSGTACGQTTLRITAATDDDWTIGEERYKNGTLLMRTTNRGLQAALAEGGSQVACTSCHGPTATSSTFVTVEHTPEQTGGFSDDELKNIFEMATVPPGGYFDPSIICGGRRNCDTTTAQQTYATFHAWSVTTDQAKGLVVYLRSLTPSPQTGVPNFMANPPRMPREAGMPVAEAGTPVTTPDADTEASTGATEAAVPSEASADDALLSPVDAAAADGGGGGG